MKNSFYQTALGMGVATGLFSLGFVIAMLIRIPPEKIGDMATWFGAIGTMLAFGGTLWIANEQKRFRTTQRHEIAMIGSVGLLDQIIDAYAASRILSDMLETESQRNFIDEEASSKFFSFAAARLDDLALWTTSDLLPLAPLPNDCASNLAKSLQVLQTTREAFQRYSKRSNTFDRKRYGKLMQSYMERLRPICDMLNAAHLECDRAARRVSTFE